MTSSTFKAADISTLTTWDLRFGKTIAGLSGSVKSFKNNTDVFDRTSGTAWVAGPDIYDTVDDRALSTTSPGGFPTFSIAHWQRDPHSDNDSAGGVAANGICDGNEDCVYRDQITGIFWSSLDNTGRSFEDAITYCDAKNFGGYTDWRVPTQKELMMAYANNIHHISPVLAPGVSFVWSSTTLPNLTNAAWVLEQFDGLINYYSKASLIGVYCVRD